MASTSVMFVERKVEGKREHSGDGSEMGKRKPR
jgi:hypothetical protein